MNSVSRVMSWRILRFQHLVCDDPGRRFNQISHDDRAPGKTQLGDSPIESRFEVDHERCSLMDTEEGGSRRRPNRSREQFQPSLRVGTSKQPAQAATARSRLPP